MKENPPKPLNINDFGVYSFLAYFIVFSVTLCTLRFTEALVMHKLALS